MDPWKLKLSQIRSLLAVAEHGNFSEAALQLNVTQSTVSHAIATLEEELGVVVFHRGRHGAQLTPVGEQLVRHAQQIKQLLDSMMNAADHERGLKGGTVRIGTFRSIATHVLPEAIARLRQRYPFIQISLLELDELYQLKQALLQGQADVCVAEMICEEAFESIHILDDEYIALLPPNSGLRNAQLTLTDLRTYPLISSSHDSCSVRIHRELAQMGKGVEVTYRIRHDSSMTGMVQQGLGIAIMPELAARPIPDGVQVCRLPFAIHRPIGATLLKSALHSPAVYAFLDALRETGEFTVNTQVG
jgi:DNA-binding transcriptional LysR family regulator